MPPAAVRARGLGKRYRLAAGLRYKAFRDVLSSTMRAPFARWAGGTSRGRSPEPDDLWALRDVSFDVQPGEVVGIIGRNGAGKTTLLRLLSRITEPTEGYAEIDGRVGSLLEVGTGFHPELTGRENIYLNGAILGMTRAETSRKFDEIVAFAETERFLDTPVKFYSSGMYVRLAFAVAAHLEPEVLLVDEVLAVGDAAFQKKCLGKMGDVARAGRTVLFVSHNLAAIQSLCRSGIVLDRGMAAMKGGVRDAVQHYMGLLHVNRDALAQPAPGMGLEIRSLACPSNGVVASDREMAFEFAFDANGAARLEDVLFLLKDQEHMLMVRDRLNDEHYPQLCGPGSSIVTVKLPPLWLRPGLYSYCLKVNADSGGVTRRVLSDPVTVQVVRRGTDGYELAGALSPRVTWTVDQQAGVDRVASAE
jgi:lipopolysaccharide transport system ATP-binding protein